MVASSTKTIPRYTDAEVEQRFLFLCERCKSFLDATKKRHPACNPISFDPILMMSISQSAMDDIWRWKVYHLENADDPKRSNAIKRAAFFTKWIVRHRPIYFPRPLDPKLFAKSFDKNDRTLLLNEGFALQLSLRFIATDAARIANGGQRVDGSTVPPIILSSSLHEGLLYDLHYRALNADALMAIYEMIMELAAKKPLIMP